MKKYSLFLLSAVIALLASCGGKTEGNHETDSLKNVVNQQLADMDETELFLDAVNVSMDSLVNMDGTILRTSGEKSMTKKQQIKQNLEAYKQILKNQRERIAVLEEKLKFDHSAMGQKMKRAIEALKQQLDEKDAVIASLTKDLESKNFDIANLKKDVEQLNTHVSELQETNKAQEEAIEAQSDMMNEGYVLIGDKNKLKTAGVLTGGSLFKKSKLDMSKMNTSAFQKIDIRKVTSFSIPGKKAEILSQAPKNSYQIKDNGNGTSTLTITEPGDFWSISNYLVIKYQ